MCLSLHLHQYTAMMMKLTLALTVATTLAVISNGHELRIENNCKHKVWPAIANNPGKPHPEKTGFLLEPHHSAVLHVPRGWAGRIWGRTGCNAHGRCETGDCGKIACNGAFGSLPTTLAEIAFDQFQRRDFYDISLVDGYNLPVAMYPIAGTFHRHTNQHTDCTPTVCKTDINAHCPHELALKGPGGHTIGCKSACTAFRTSEYCCTGAHSKANTCLRKYWKVDYPDKFKHWCPDAYSFAYDDKKSTWSCISSSAAHQSGYVVKFCP